MLESGVWRSQRSHVDEAGKHLAVVSLEWSAHNKEIIKLKLLLDRNTSISRLTMSLNETTLDGAIHLMWVRLFPLTVMRE